TKLAEFNKLRKNLAAELKSEMDAAEKAFNKAKARYESFAGVKSEKIARKVKTRKGRSGTLKQVISDFLANEAADKPKSLDEIKAHVKSHKLNVKSVSVTLDNLKREEAIWAPKRGMWQSIAKN